MRIQVRARDKDPLAQFLGWFSIGLGTAQLTAPRMLCRVVGADAEGAAPRLMRLMGVRELTQGTGILVRPRPTTWLWSRVAGDALDLSLLGLIAVKNRRARTAFAIANVLAVTVPDVYESRFLSRKKAPVRVGEADPQGRHDQPAARRGRGGLGRRGRAAQQGRGGRRRGAFAGRARRPRHRADRRVRVRPAGRRPRRGGAEADGQGPRDPALRRPAPPQAAGRDRRGRPLRRHARRAPARRPPGQRAAQPLEEAVR